MDKKIIEWKESEINKLVDKFLAWPLPKSVHPDTCVIDPHYRETFPNCPLTGTNLLTADEARQMIQYLLDS